MNQETITVTNSLVVDVSAAGSLGVVATLANRSALLAQRYFISIVVCSALISLASKILAMVRAWSNSNSSFSIGTEIKSPRLQMT